LDRTRNALLDHRVGAVVSRLPFPTKFELIASGQAIAITASFHGNSLRPDITTVPLENVEPSHVVLATRAGDRSRLVAAFRKLAESHRECAASFTFDRKCAASFTLGGD
jgi:hypothetical protein